MRRIHGGDERYKDNITSRLVPERVSECSLMRKGPTNGTCLSMEAVKYLASATGLDHIKNDDKSVMEQIRKRYGAIDDRFLIKELPKEMAVREHAFFKMDGPVGTKLLSNTDIDSIMNQWHIHWPKFYAYNFNMLNYTEYNFRDGRVRAGADTLASVDPRELFEVYNCAGCIINSDTYQGSGKHWMALFADNRDPNNATVEFFNSSGRSPMPEWCSWMNRVARALETKNGKRPELKCGNIIQQESMTECGPYSLFYIWARLNGTPASYFNESRIPDELVMEFRSHLYSDGVPGTFNFDEYSKSHTVKWDKSLHNAKDRPLRAERESKASSYEYE